jgi:hypothetical protein
VSGSSPVLSRKMELVDATPTESNWTTFAVTDHEQRMVEAVLMPNSDAETRLSSMDVKYRASDQIDSIRRFLCLKIAVSTVFLGLHHLVPIPVFLLGFCGIVLALSPSDYWLGTLTGFFLASIELVEPLPFTINHRLFEWFALLTLLLLAEPRRPSSKVRMAAQAKQILVVAFASIWFFAGLQKLANGYYLTGEFYILEATDDQGSLGAFLRMLVFAAEFTVSCCGALPSEHLVSISGYGPTIPFHVMYFLQGLAIVTIGAELVISALALKWRAAAYVLFGLQVAVAGTTGEWDFGITGLAILTLFFAREHKFFLLVLLVFHAINEIA